MNLNELAVAAKGDQGLAEQLLRRTWPALERYAERHRHSIDSSDLTQEFALVFGRYVDRFDPAYDWSQFILQRFKWFCFDVKRMAKHQPIGNYRSGNTQVQSISANRKTMVGHDCVEIGSTIEREYRNPRTERHTFMRLIHHLPDKQRLILSLYYIEQMTMAEIADAINLSDSRVSQLYNDALNTLRAVECS